MRRLWALVRRFLRLEAGPEVLGVSPHDLEMMLRVTVR